MNADTIANPSVIRSGHRYWIDSYRNMLRFEIVNLRSFLAVVVVIQILMGAGMAYMYGFYFGDMPEIARTYIVTGIPALALVPVGFVLVPSSIMNHKFRDTYDFVWSLPVPRLASAAATFTVFTSLAIPGTIVSLWVAQLRYSIDLQVSWSIVPAIALTSLMATSVGFTIGHAIPDPRLTNLVTNLIIFLALMFSPIVAPIEQFPNWWASVHEVLPLYNMANVIRAGLSEGLVVSLARSWAILGAWSLASWVLAAWVVGRRR
jgi:ABC-2 type transport system permease protein